MESKVTGGHSEVDSDKERTRNRSVLYISDGADQILPITFPFQLVAGARHVVSF